MADKSTRDQALPSSEAESIALLTLGATKGIGYRVLYQLFKVGVRFTALLGQPNAAGAAQVLESAKLKNARGLAQAIWAGRAAAEESAYAMLGRLNEDKIRLVHFYDESFPPSLRAIAHPPGWLFIQGNPEALSRPLVAIVGTRNPSPSGEFLTECVCRILAGMDFGTVSGLAAGIDERVHTLSLVLHLPTIAVLGTGILRDYPAHTRPLRRAIAQGGGCIVTEYFPDEGPGRENFVWRNRLQAGLAKVVIPTEWQLNSGTAHTVNFAMESGKAVVGVVTDRLNSETARFLVERRQQVFHLPLESAEFLDYLCKVFS